MPRTVNITLSDDTFTEAQSLAEPLVDTLDSLIAKLIHEEVGRRKVLPNGNGKTTTEKEDHPLRGVEIIFEGNGKAMADKEDHLLHLDPDSHDNLTHTRVLSVTLDGREYRADWNGLLQDLLIRARKVRSWEEFRRISAANVRQGRYEKDGYRYMQDGDFSVQGVDANRAWEHSLAIAREEKIPIKVAFEWRDRDGAAHPGQTGVLEWTPKELLVR